MVNYALAAPLIHDYDDLWYLRQVNMSGRFFLPEYFSLGNGFVRFVVF